MLSCACVCVLVRVRVSNCSVRVCACLPFVCVNVRGQVEGALVRRVRAEMLRLAGVRDADAGTPQLAAIWQVWRVPSRLAHGARLFFFFSLAPPTSIECAPLQLSAAPVVWVRYSAAWTWTATGA